MSQITARPRVLGFRQYQVIQFVRSYHREHGIAPSYTIIRDELDFSSTADVCNVVRRLEKRGGYLSRTGNRRVRRIRLPQTGSNEEGR